LCCSAPSNIEWIIEDAEDDWVYAELFDYIHGRALRGCFKSPYSIFEKAFAALKPGGWFEIQDAGVVTSLDGTAIGTAVGELAENFRAASERTGYLWDHDEKYGEYMKAAGFVDVVEHDLRWPTNPYWPEDEKDKILGLWWQAQLKIGALEGITTRLFMGLLGWDKEKLDEFLARVKVDMRRRDVRAFIPL
jgi:hypothetical protein